MQNMKNRYAQYIAILSIDLFLWIGSLVAIQIYVDFCTRVVENMSDLELAGVK